MSMERTEYLMMGIDIIDQVKNMTEDEIEILQEEVNNSENLDIIYDWVSEEFCYVGITLRISSEHIYGDSKTTELDCIDLVHLREIVDIELEETVKDKIDWLCSDIKLIAFHRYL